MKCKIITRGVYVLFKTLEGMVGFLNIFSVLLVDRRVAIFEHYDQQEELTP